MEFNVNLKDAKSRVIIEKGCVTHLKDYVDFNGKVMIISDDYIPTSLKELVLNQLEDATLIEVKMGEVSKSVETYQMLVERLLELGFSRKDSVIALGGGVIGDLSGYVASTFKR